MKSLINSFNFYKLILASLVLMIVFLSKPYSVLAAEVNVYSARKENLIKPLLDRFTDKTGITVRLITGKADALTKKIDLEGKNTVADILVTTDAGRLYRAQSLGILQPFTTPIIESLLTKKIIDRNIVEPQNYWVGLTIRARTIVYNPKNIEVSKLSTYEDLASDRFKNDICIRSSNNIYNQSLVSSIIVNRGVTATQEWLDGFVKNFARKPKGGDRDQIGAVAVGQCSVGIVNTYYLAGMLDSYDKKKVNLAKKVKVFWPNQKQEGVHVNISGIAITKYAKNVTSASRLIEFMLSEEAQKWYAETNHEYPVRTDVKPSKLLQSWGKFKQDSQPLAEYGRLNKEAVILMDKAGWK